MARPTLLVSLGLLAAVLNAAADYPWQGLWNFGGGQTNWAEFKRLMKNPSVSEGPYTMLITKGSGDVYHFNFDSEHKGVNVSGDFRVGVPVTVSSNGTTLTVTFTPTDIRVNVKNQFDQFSKTFIPRQDPEDPVYDAYEVYQLGNGIEAKRYFEKLPIGRY